jgi:hypothetical protein
MNRREVHVTETPARVDRFDVGFDHGRLPNRFGDGGRLRLVTFATASACLALAAAAQAGLGEASIAPAPAGGPLVSPQYQAQITDTGAKAGPPWPAANPSGGVTHVAAGSDLGPAVAGAQPRPTRRLVAGGQPRRVPTWYRSQNAQYQLYEILQYQFHRLSAAHLRGDAALSSPEMPSLRTSNRSLIVKTIAPWIVQTDARSRAPGVISSTVRPTAPKSGREQVADARLLLRLGLALGLAYVVFLVAWFWSTRHRTHGVARVVRF